MKTAGFVMLACAAVLAAAFGPGTPLGGVIFRVAPAFLNTLQAGVQRRLAPWLWDDLMLPALEAPGWLVPAVLGLVLLLAGLVRAGRRRHGAGR
jgi:hypothetical protein